MIQIANKTITPMTIQVMRVEDMVGSGRMADLLAGAIYDQPRSEGSGCDFAQAGDAGGISPDLSRLQA
jgi:hypothetical protein